MNKGGPKKFQFGFPSKKLTATSTQAIDKTLPTEKRKATDGLSNEIPKKPRSTNLVLDDEDEFLASAGIGKAFVLVLSLFITNILISF